jgi:hypothetical protein
MGTLVGDARAWVERLWADLAGVMITLGRRADAGLTPADELGVVRWIGWLLGLLSSLTSILLGLLVAWLLRPLPLPSLAIVSVALIVPSIALGRIAHHVTYALAMAWYRRPQTAPQPLRRGANPEPVPVARTYRSERGAFGTVVILLLVASTLYAALDDLLTGMHVPGAAGHGVQASLAALLQGPPAGWMQAAVTSWRDHAAEPALYARSTIPLFLAAADAFIDSLFLVPAYGVLSALLLVWGRRIIDEELYLPPGAGPGAEARRQRRDRQLAEHLARRAPWALIALVVAVGADWIENLAQVAGLSVAWHAGTTLPRLLPLLAALTAVATVAKVIGFFGVGAWLLAVFVLMLRAPRALATVQLDRPQDPDAVLLAEGTPPTAPLTGPERQPWPRVAGAARTLLVVRVPVAVLLAFGALVQYEQSTEVFRRWPSDPWSAGAGLAGIVALAAVVLLSSGCLLALTYRPVASPPVLRVGGRVALRYRRLVARMHDRAPLLAGQIAGALNQCWFSLVAALGVLLAVLSLGLRTPRPAIPFIVLVLLVGVTSTIFQGAATTAHQPRPLAVGTVPGYLAAAICLIAALKLIRTGIEWWTYAVARQLSDGRDGRALLGYAAVLLLAAGAFALAQPLAGRFARLATPGGRADGLGPLVLALVLIVVPCLAWWGGAMLLQQDLDNHGPLLFEWLPRVGPIAVACAGFIVAGIFGSGLTLLSDRLGPPLAVFRALGARHTPLLSLLVLWLMIASGLPGGEDIHQARLLNGVEPRAGMARGGEPLGVAFDGWVKRLCLLPAGQATQVVPQKKRVVPLIMVASSGGGIRAAAWTSYVMDANLGYTAQAPSLCGGSRQRSDYVFVASGVSGGSVGIAGYAARLIAPGAANEEKRDNTVVPGPEGSPWVKERLGHDNLTPSLAWLMLVETPWSFIRAGIHDGRGAVLERTWERNWGETDTLKATGLFALREQHPEVPLLLLNGTSVESGCRFVATTLDVGTRKSGDPIGDCLTSQSVHPRTGGLLGGTNGSPDFVCSQEDMRLSTAAILSARFPVISPSGRLALCQGGAPPGAASRTEVVDGGYLEGSGTGTLLSLWPALADLVNHYNARLDAPAYIVPVLLQIDSGYTEPSAPGVASTLEFLAPVTTLLAVRASNEALARQGAQVLFSDPFRVSTTTPAGCVRYGGRFAHFPLRAHPGPQAQLGWILSPAAFSDLLDQYHTLSHLPGSPSPDSVVDAWLEFPSAESSFQPGPCAGEEVAAR